MARKRRLAEESHSGADARYASNNRSSIRRVLTWLIANDENGNSYNGYMGSFGFTAKVPFPVEFHAGLTNSRVIYSYNMYEVMADIYHAIEAW